MRAVLLYNPSAGMGDHAGDDLVAALTVKGISVTCCSVDNPGYQACLAQDADVLIVAGGDGTVYKAMAHHPDRRRPLAIIPLGGSNNIATSLGFDSQTVLTGDWPKNTALRTFHVGKVRRLSDKAMVVEGVGFGALATSIDLEAPTSHSAREKTLNGRRGLATALAEAEPLAVEIIVDGHHITGSWLMAEVLTATHSGPRLPLVPHAHALGGQFAVVLLGEDERLTMLEWLNAPDKSRPPVQVLAARSVSFRTGHQMRLRIDDDIETVRDQRIDLWIDDDPFHVLLPAEPDRKGD